MVVKAAPMSRTKWGLNGPVSGRPAGRLRRPRIRKVRRIVPRSSTAWPATSSSALPGAGHHGAAGPCAYMNVPPARRAATPRERRSPRGGPPAPPSPRVAPRLGGVTVVLGPEARLPPGRALPRVSNVSLARSYFQKARKRLRALGTLFEDEAYSDVIREAQELVELALPRTSS